MSEFEEGCKLLNEKFGNNQDKLIAIATVGVGVTKEGKPFPVVRTVDAMYENGTFYVTTNSNSGKMLQIKENPEVAIDTGVEWFTATGVGENLGWVMEPKNAELRQKLRKTFAAWYDSANNENDKNCCIMAIHLVKGILNINHWQKLYHMDFINKVSN